MKTTQNRSLNAFAQDYSSFKDNQSDTYIGSIVAILDTSVDENGKSTGEENYFTYLDKALDTTQPNTFRKDNAEKALASYSEHRKYTDVFSEKILKLDSVTSKLVESANRIDNNENRVAAVEISVYARQIQQDYESMRLKYIERFNLQTKLLGELVKSNGDILSIESSLINVGKKIIKLNDDIDDLTENIDMTSKKMNDAYYSLKGRAGINYNDEL